MMIPTVRDRTGEFERTLDAFKKQQKQGVVEIEGGEEEEQQQQQQLLSQEIGTGNGSSNINGGLSLPIPTRRLSGSSTTTTTTTNTNVNTNTNTVKKELMEISNRIHSQANSLVQQMSLTSDKTQQLIDLAKSTSNFRDERPKIQRLVLVIKQDMERLDNDLKTITVVIKQYFSPKDISKDNCACHHYNLLDILQYKYSHLAKTFANACQVSTHALEVQKEQRDKYGGSGLIKTTRPLKNRLQRQKQLEASTEEEKERLLREDNNNNIIAPRNQQNQSQLLIQIESDYNESRAAEAMYVEKQLNEVAQMMNQLATYVEHQGTSILLIDQHTQEAITHVEGAIEQLQKTLANLASNRWLIIKIFAILIIFAIIFTVFIA